MSTATQDHIIHSLKNSLSALGFSEKLEIQLDRPTRSGFGDWTTNLALQGIKDQRSENRFQNPRQLAEALVVELKKEIQSSHLQSLISDIQVAGPGFINFFVSKDFYVAEMGELIQKEGKVTRKKNAGKKVIVEFSSPNIAKPFTIGHLRSTIIGDAVANVLDATGYQVFRDNHLGDWGTQFGKLIVAIKKWGDLEAIEKSENPVKDLVDLYIKFHDEAEKNPEFEDEGRAWFKKLEDGDIEARELWQKCIDWSWKEFDRIYAQLNVHFTENNGKGYGESYFEDKMSEVVSELKSSKFLKDGKEGAQLFFFPNEELAPLMILKKDGSTLYATRDLATDKFRLKQYGEDVLVINEVGAEQEFYFRQLYKIEELLGWYKPGQRVHVKHGMFRFKDVKMSTRKGNVIWLNDVIEEAKKRAGERFKVQGSSEKSSKVNHASVQAVAIGALKWNDLKRASHLDVVFDWDEILSMEGNSGPYLQYVYVRTISVLKKFIELEKSLNQAWFDDLNDFSSEREVAKLLQPEEIELLQKLSQFGEVVEQSADLYEPHHLCTYLYQTAQLFNTFYNKHTILGEALDKKELTPQTWLRLNIVRATKEVIGEGLRLLGIQTVEEM